MNPSNGKLQFYEPSDLHPVEELAETIREWILSVTSPDLEVTIQGYGVGGKILYFRYQNEFVYWHIAIWNNQLYLVEAQPSFNGVFFEGKRRNEFSPVCAEAERILLRSLDERGLLRSALSVLLDGFETDLS